MPKLRVTGFFVAASIVFVSASGCAVQTSDSSAAASEEALLPPHDNDPVSEGIIDLGMSHEGWLLLEANYPDMRRIAWLRNGWSDVDAPTASPSVHCMVKSVAPYCDPPAKTDAKWDDKYDHGRPHFLAAARCNLSPQRIAVLVNQCGGEAEAFQSANNFRALTTDEAWFAVDPTGSGPHLNPGRTPGKQ